MRLEATYATTTATMTSGTSATPSVAQAHDGEVVSGVITAGGGVTFGLDARLSVVAEAEALFFWPSVAIQIGNSEVAHVGSATLFAHAGLLARF